MKKLRYWLLKVLAGRTAVVLNTDVHFAGAGCHLETHNEGANMFLANSHLGQASVFLAHEV